MAHILVRAGKLVGVFYCSPQPGEPEFVREGDSIDDGTDLYIISAMKTYNAVKWNKGIKDIADVVWKDSGKPYDFRHGLKAVIRKIYAKNETAITSDDLLFELEVPGSEPSMVVASQVSVPMAT